MKSKLKKDVSLLVAFSLLAAFIAIPAKAAVSYTTEYSVTMNCRYENYATGQATWVVGSGCWYDTDSFRGSNEDEGVFNDGTARQLALENYGNHWTVYPGTNASVYLVKSRTSVSHVATTEGGPIHHYHINLYWAPKYNISYVYNGSPCGSTTALGGETVSVRSAPTGQGYTFSGWTTSTAVVSNGTFVVPANDVIFYGSGSPRKDTPYTVKFYLQNADDGSYTEQTGDTMSRKGTTNTQIRAALDMTSLNTQYPHYHLTDASKADTTTIGGGGTSVLKLYYDMDAANVSYVYTGNVPSKAPALPPAAAQPYGTTVTVAQAPQLPGYDFSGWTSENADITSGAFTMLDQDVTISGSWTPRTDTPYTVEYYQQNIDDDDYTLADTEHCTGTTDTMAVLPEKTYPGFTMTPASVTASTSTNIDGDGTTLLKLCYNRNVNTVTYAYSGQTDVTPPALPGAATYRYGQTVDVDASSTLQGYEFGGWETSDAEVSEGQFTMPDGPVIITGKWIARTDTPFTVEYYQQNIQDDAYTLAYTFNGKGTTGGNIPHKEFTGFTEVPDSVTAEGSVKIKSDGTTFLKLYYGRNVNTVTYAYSEETDATPPELPAEASYRYGQAVTLAAAPVLAGYDFGGWATSDAEVTQGQFTMPDGPVAITGRWKTRTDTPFTVQYYQQNVDNDDYTLAETLNGTGTTGANIPHKEFAGFVETPDSVTAEGSAKIKSDGTTLLKLYYDRSSYQVAFAYSGTAPEDAPALPEVKSYRYGAEVPIPEVPGVLSGMNFSGWFLEGKQLSDKTFSVPAQDTKISGSWSQIPDSDDESVTPVTEQPVQTLEDNGSAYIIGYEDGTFRPDDYLTAKHEALMLSRLGLSVTPLSAVPDTSDDERYITRREFISALLEDSGAAAAEVSDPMTQAAALGWISGYTNGELYPEAYITRAQAVTIINRAFGRADMQEDESRISYTDLPRDYWAYDAIIAASTAV